MVVTSLSCRRRAAFALALGVAFGPGTALGEPASAARIPATDENPDASAVAPLGASAGAASLEPPPPYEPWQGPGFAAPEAPDRRPAPPPLARPPEERRRPFELSSALAAFLPNCGSGDLNDQACVTLAPGSGVEALALYRPNPFFAFGAEAALSGFRRSGQGALSASGGGVRFFGVAGRVYFADDGVWDPYVGLTLGVGTLELAGAERASSSTTGVGARVALGIDFRGSTRLRFGPSASFSHWFAWSERSCAAGICSGAAGESGKLFGFATLGVRVTAAFGDTL